jgi:H+/Cl- antiporter ClcA
MTKTCAAVVPFCYAMLSVPVSLPVATDPDPLVVSNFEFGHWDLFEIWIFLVLGIFI